MVKVTFTVDDETVRTLRTIAERLGKPQSMVVREAVAEMALGQAA
jgi:predicted transcriptional regulator